MVRGMRPLAGARLSVRQQRVSRAVCSERQALRDRIMS